MNITPRTRWAMIAAVAVLVVVAAGAAIAASTASTSDPGHPGNPDAPVSSGPITGDQPPVDGGPTLVEPRSGMADVYARPFDTATVSNDGMTVTVDFVSGLEPCSVLDHVDVRYGPDTVTITLYEGHDPSAGDVACIEIGVFKRTIVQLDEALEGRRIVDGAA